MQLCLKVKTKSLKNWKPRKLWKKFLQAPCVSRKELNIRNLMTIGLHKKILGLEKILELSKKLEVFTMKYPRLSVSLGTD